MCLYTVHFVNDLPLCLFILSYLYLITLKSLTFTNYVPVVTINKKLVELPHMHKIISQTDCYEIYAQLLGGIIKNFGVVRCLLR